MTPRPFAPYQNTRRWEAVEAMITELTSSGEITVNTAPDYVVG